MEQQRIRFSWRSGIVVALVAVAVALACMFVAQPKDATAVDSDSSTTGQMTINLTASGDTDGATYNMDRNMYTVGDTPVLKWKGARSGSDLIIPTEITVNGNVRYSVSDLIKVNQLQSNNSEYHRRMNSYGNMTTFDALESYVARENSASLGSLTLSVNTVEITWMRVKPVYRLYNMITSEHLFTTNKTEYDNFWTSSLNNTDAWIGEGISWLSPANGSSSGTVYRFYNAALGAMGESSHYYSKNQTEIATLQQNGWTNDGMDNAFQSGGTTQIWTCYNQALGSAHHYTSSKEEWDGLSVHGWDLEKDKNGSEGVFQGLVATSWSYSTNYYKVNHVVAGTTYTEWKEGSAGTQTAATALSFPGYEAGQINNVIISANNNTIVNINYTPQTYAVKFDTRGGSALDSKSVAYGSKIGEVAEPTRSGYKFAGWALDATGINPVDLDTYTMPAGDLTLYAQWETSNTYTVKFDKNDNAASGSMSDTIKTIGDGAQLPANAFTKVDVDVVYGFKAWNTKKDGSGETISDKFTGDLTSTGGDTVTLYAQWTTEDINPYWIAAAKATTTGNTAQTANISNPDYTNPETSVERTASEIKADIEILKDTSNSKYAETLARYQNYMNSDKYHLYTKIADGNYDDCYFEFRIVGIGGHTSTGNKTDGTKYNDGSVLTFQGTHSLPYSFRVNADKTNEGGWMASDLGVNINSDAVLSAYSKGLTDALTSVQKWNRTGSTAGEINNTITSSNDKMWLMSYSELIGGSPSSWSSAGLEKEGDQYDFWKNKGLSSITANRALTELSKTRSGGAAFPDPEGKWHLRSASPKNTTDFLYVDAYGTASTSLAADTYGAIIPCFTMGTSTYTVSFDTDGGSNIDSQQVPTGGYATAPTGTIRWTKEGYHLEGWYTDKNYASRFDFEHTPITESITLYAKFEPDTTTRYTIDVYEEVENGTYSTTRTRYIDATGTTDAQTVAKDVEPSEGFEFEKSTETTVTGDGKAVASVYFKRKSYSVTFNMKDVETTSKPSDIAAQKFGTYITADNPVATGWQFGGWYIDQEATTTRFDLAGNTMPAQNLFLYAKWTPAEEGKAAYTIRHFQQGTDGNYPDKATEITYRQGVPGEETVASAKTFTGFSVDGSVPVETIKEDGSTTIDIKYKRNTHTVTFIDNTKTAQGEVVQTLTNQLYGAPITAATAPTSENVSRVFTGWALNDANADAFDFEDGTMPDSDITFYSKWSIGMAWVAPSAKKTTGNTADTVDQDNPLYQGSPATGVIKYIDTLAADIAILRDPSNAQYEAKVAEYKGYMNQDNYHLYTTWKGQTDDNDGVHYENTYLEFRIIQVGEHDDDGSVLTLQGTHTVPTAWNISDNESTQSGWEGSPLRTKMIEMGKEYSSSVPGMFKTITKETMKGGGDKTVTTTQDAFWIASHTELVGLKDGKAYFGNAEGSQYDWYKQIGITDNSGQNPALVRRTRAGNVPKGVSDGAYQGSYWTRTPNQTGVANNRTVIIGNTGYQRTSYKPNLNTGVVVCFAV